MNVEELKALQARIKERYKKDPAAALITLRAGGRLGEGLACRVDTGKGLVDERYCVVMQTIRNSVPVRVS